MRLQTALEQVPLPPDARDLSTLSRIDYEDAFLVETGPAQGWELRHNTPEFALLGAGSRIGMPAELLFKPQRDTLLFATLVQHQNAAARAIWAPVVPMHQRVVRDLLGSIRTS
jgi:hypothetical protein